MGDMDRSDLQQLSKEQLIELVLRLQRPDKNSRTSSKPPSTDKKERRENSRPGGAKLGHEPHNRRLADNPDEFRDHVRSVCEACSGAFSLDAERELIGEYDEIEIPPVKPYVIPPSSLRLPMQALRRRRESSGAGGGDHDAVRAAHPCAGDLSERLSGAVLRAAARSVRRWVRARCERGRADEHVHPQPCQVPDRSVEGEGHSSRRQDCG